MMLQFPFLSVDQCIFFLHSFTNHTGSKFGSWFVEQKVVGDGRLYVASPMDPKFLLLPVMEKHGTRFSPLEQVSRIAW